jgi:ATP-dependent DNA ligase
VVNLRSPLLNLFKSACCCVPCRAGFIAPCLPTKTDKLPSGGLWLHEIKHDGFRIIARKDGERVRLYSRDFTRRFLLIVDALSRLRSRSCIILQDTPASGKKSPD